MSDSHSLAEFDEAALDSYFENAAAGVPFDPDDNDPSPPPNNNDDADVFVDPPTPVMSQHPPTQGDDDEYDPDNNSNDDNHSDQHAVSPTISSQPYAPLSQSLTQPNHSNSQFVMSDMTAVDGHGMWVSWTRVFDQPRFAMLDLLDNCLDASLQKANFDGRVVMKRLNPNGIIIMNNSAKPIKSLKEVLVVYASSKRDKLGHDNQKKTDAIGENGVGLKHGCATLSDTNIVISRNYNTYGVGIIAKSLQTKEGVNLPSFEFTVEDDEDKEPHEIEAELRHHLETIITMNPKIAECIEASIGSGNLEAGLKVLVERCQEMWNDYWEPYDHVFQVIIAEMIHSHDQSGQDQDNVEVTSRRAHHGNNPAALFLHEIKNLLPKFYVNIPTQGFEFYIEQEKIVFSYWQHRLVEMTKFRVHVPKEMAIADMKHFNWADDGYPLSIYCGFEALRVQDDERGDACQMYIYSRSSGRLIKHDDDARASLGLAASGVDYCQGLTVIVDDVDAQLPLMPTKQGIAWTEQRGGEAHRANLMAWAGACAQCFWLFHAKRFQRKCNTNAYKKVLRETLEEYADVIRNHLHQHQNRNSNHSNNNYAAAALERLETAHFSSLGELSWKKEITKQNRKLKIKKHITQDMYIEPGEATIFKFLDRHYPSPDSIPPPIPRPAAKKRRLDDTPPPDLQMSWQQQQQQTVWQQQQQWQRQRQQQQQIPQLGWQQQPPPPPQQEVIVLDDDDDSAPAAKPAAAAHRQVARKSTGSSNAAASAKANGAVSTNERSLRRAFFACQEELREQKRLMAETQIQHQDEVRRLRAELSYAQQQALQNPTQNGLNHQGGSGGDSEALREARDELTIVKRQKKQLDKDLKEVREQRGTEVSGLKLEIESLKLKTEEQARKIKHLKNGGTGSPQPSSPVKDLTGNDENSWMSRMVKVKHEFQDADEI